jgi:hypothetical protein
MVLTREELLSSLKNEVRILLHLASKVDPAKVDYRPTPKQRSTLELLRYMTFMGPFLVSAIKTGNFDPATWSTVEAAAARLDLAGAIAALEQQPASYARGLEEYTDDDLRGNTTLFGQTASRGSMIVNMVLCACAAYRTQLFLYLKSCGREELNTWNLWAGIDGEM